MTAPRVVKVALEAVETLGDAGRSCGVIEICLSDGREFSVLASTPAWFEEKLRQLGLDFYYGHSILFLKAVKLDVAKKAAKELAKNDAWLCLYDTPRTSVSRVLEDFRQRH
ncbi:MAG: hypothetical protein HY927_08785 [Elusimicrobia bacterium]|nr:hypothetical protein [Elusimicrobiota bacterium]